MIHSLPPEPPERISQGELDPWSLRFVDEGREAAYRLDRLGRDRHQARIAIGLAATSGAIFLWGDQMRYGTGRRFLALGLLRLLYLVFSGVVWQRLRRLDTQSLDRLTSAWLFFALVVVLLVNATRPALQLGHLLVNVVAVMGIYVWLPVPVAVQILGGLFLTGSELAGIAWAGGSDAPTDLALAVAFTLSNVIGLGSSRQLRSYDRQRFVALEEERRARESMLAAIAEVRVLRGLLPICAWCQRIREDDGSWQRLERYVARHSEAEFTHGICEECLARNLGPGTGATA